MNYKAGYLGIYFLRGLGLNAIAIFKKFIMLETENIVKLSLKMKCLDGTHIGWVAPGKAIHLSYCQLCLIFLTNLIPRLVRIETPNKWKSGVQQL